MSHSAKYKPKPFTDIFTNDSDINRRKCVRTVPMKVLILGMGRTGIESMGAALKQLGYLDTYKLKCCSDLNPPDSLMWMDALCAKYDGQGAKFTRKQWDQLLGNVEVVSDWPAIAFAKELIEAYPEAKVILTNRDVDKWYESTLNTLHWRANDPELGWLSHVDWAAGMYYPMLTKFFNTFFEGDFPGRGKEIFRRHYHEVRRLVPKDRLLEYTVSDGWAPLCKFLGEPVPKGRPFPDINDDADFVSQAQSRNKNQMKNVALHWLVWILAVLIAIESRAV